MGPQIGSGLVAEALPRSSRLLPCSAQALSYKYSLSLPFALSCKDKREEMGVLQRVVASVVTGKPRVSVAMYRISALGPCLGGELLHGLARAGPAKELCPFNHPAAVARNKMGTTTEQHLYCYRHDYPSVESSPDIRRPGAKATRTI